MGLFSKKPAVEVVPPPQLQAQFQELSPADKAALPQPDWDRAGELVGEHDDIVLVRIATGLFPESRVIWVITQQAVHCVNRRGAHRVPISEIDRTTGAEDPPRLRVRISTQKPFSHYGSGDAVPDTGSSDDHEFIFGSREQENWQAFFRALATVGAPVPDAIRKAVG